jgi:MATE family multidrug resistance protein
MARAKGSAEDENDEQHRHKRQEKNGSAAAAAIRASATTALARLPHHNHNHVGSDGDGDGVAKPLSPGEPRCRPWRDEAAAQLRTALPTLASLLLYKIPWMVSLRFVGQLGSADWLAAAALATTLCNVTGMSLSVGLSSALTTLASQSRGELLNRKKSRANGRAVRFADDGNGSKSSNGTDAAPDETARLLPPEGGRRRNGNQGPASSEPLLLPLVYLYRGLAIQLAVLLPVGAWWIWGVGPALAALGQGGALASLAAPYLRVLAPGMWCYSVNWTVAAWLQALEMAHVTAGAALAGLLLHVPFNFLFVYGLGWGYLGCAAAATVAFQVVQPVLAVGYVFGTESGRKRALEAMTGDASGRSDLPLGPELWAAVADLRGCLSYLGLALPGIVIISEWWASEVSIFLAGRLVPSPDLALGALTLNQTLNTFCFMFPTAFGVAGSARVGALLGGGDADGARFASRVCAACAGLASAALGLVVYWTPHEYFPSLFAPGQADLERETSRTMALLAAYVVADGLQAAFYGAVKGCGRQPAVMPVVVFAYWVVGVPLAYFISFVKFRGVMCESNYFCGQVGLVAGMTVGT